MRPRTVGAVRLLVGAALVPAGLLFANMSTGAGRWVRPLWEMSAMLCLIVGAAQLLVAAVVLGRKQ